MLKLTKIVTDILLFSLLAAVCVGSAELIYCYKSDPALYEKIVSPIVSDIEERLSDRPVAITAQPVPLAEDTEPAPPSETAEPGTAAGGDATQLATEPSIERLATIADPTVTAFVTGKYGTVLTGGSVSLAYYNQADEAWALCPFGVDTIDKYGCGPTVMAMIVSSFTETKINPEKMAVWAHEQGYASPGHGSFHSIVPGTCEVYGLECESLGDLTADQLREKLAGGGVIVALMGEGHFTSSGHFIVLHGVTLTGEILVADPNSRENSLMTWEPQMILDELSPATDSGAPMWLVSPK